MIEKKGYSLIRHSSYDQSIWKNYSNGDIYLTDKSGDDDFGYIGCPEDTEDGPLRVSKPDKLILKLHDGKGAPRAALKCIKERSGDEGVIMFGAGVAAALSEQWKIPIFLDADNHRFKLTSC